MPETPVAPDELKVVVMIKLVLRQGESGDTIEEPILGALLNAPYLMRRVDAIQVHLA